MFGQWVERVFWGSQEARNLQGDKYREPKEGCFRVRIPVFLAP
jgi:hypothetical protein